MSIPIPVIPFDEQNTDDAAGKKTNKTNKTKKTKKNRLIRGVANWLSEESAAAGEDYETLRKLRNNPKY